MINKKSKISDIIFLLISIMLVGIISCFKMKDKPGPLITNIYTADPSAHVFEGKLYIYPSHDIESNIPETNEGDQFNMKDYHVFSLEDIDKPIIDHGEVLNLVNIPWAKKQLWAPDAAFKNNTYYFYFPAKDKDGIFRIGVATGKSPAGPFKAQPKPIDGSFSIDPCVFTDDDGTSYMYFGGLMGGQLQRWTTGKYNPNSEVPSNGRQALGPRIARMTGDMLGYEEIPKEIIILNEKGKPIRYGDSRIFFEAAWVHKYKGIYYLSYSTGYSRYIAYATCDNPYGPFIFKGYILSPVIGWTTHHSIVEFKGKWYLFYHDSSLSQGIMHLRCVKVAELHYNPDGTIKMIDPYKK